MIQIDTADRISIDGKSTGLALRQEGAGSVVYTPADHLGKGYAVHKMPHARYATSHDAPASGAAGRTQLEADIRALLAAKND